MLAFSNVLAAIAVVLLLIVSFKWVAPTLRSRMICASFAGIPYLAGQVCQVCKWWPIWVQHHLLDGSYMLWGTGVVLAGLLLLPSLSLFLIRKFLPKRARITSILDALDRFTASVYDKISDKLLIIGSFTFITLLAIAGELSDSYQAGGSLVSTLDWGDCIAFSIGGIVTVLLHVLHEKIQEIWRSLKQAVTLMTAKALPARD